MQTDHHSSSSIRIFAKTLSVPFTFRALELKWSLTGQATEMLSKSK